MRSPREKLSIAVFVAFFCAVGLKAQAAGTYPDGTLLRAVGDARVYVVTAGRKRHVPNESVFRANGWSWADLREVALTELDAIPPTRVVKMPSSATIFDISSGARVPVTSSQDFLSRGYSWAEVATVLDEELASYPLPDLGPPVVAPAPVEPRPAEAPTAGSVLVGKIDLARGMLHAAMPLYPQETRIAPMRAMTTGSAGTDVELVQKRLQELGFFPANVAVNGYFGPATLRAVKAFQANQGLEQVGRVGEKTIAALLKNGLKRPETGSVVKRWSELVPNDRKVLIAAWNPATDDMQAVSITLKFAPISATRSAYEVVTHTPGFTVQRRSGSGVNVQYAVTSPQGYQVLANRFPIFDAKPGEVGSFPPSEEVYVPYSDELRTPEIVAAGRQYLDAKVIEALSELRNKGIVSASGSGLVADSTDINDLKNIAIIEHMDSTEFIKADDKHGVINRIFTILGTNKEDAYRFAGSSAGALGMAQFIESTYHSVRSKYPAAGLLPGFKEGMADHVNAFKAMALYQDSSNASLESVVKEKLAIDPLSFTAVMAEVRAAAYNGGPVRVKAAVKRHGSAWNTVPARPYGIFAETKDYLEKYKAVRQYLAAM